MTKTEARAWLRRSREAVRQAELALRENDPASLLDAVQEMSGSACEIETALTDGRGEGSSVAGMRVPT